MEGDICSLQNAEICFAVILTSWYNLDYFDSDILPYFQRFCHFQLWCCNDLIWFDVLLLLLPIICDSRKKKSTKITVLVFSRKIPIFTKKSTFSREINVFTKEDTITEVLISRNFFCVIAFFSIFHTAVQIKFVFLERFHGKI